MQSQTALSFILQNFSIFVAAVFLTVLAWNLWLSYVQTTFVNSIKWVLLEVRPPKDVFKPPLAMELVLQSLYQTGGTGTWFDKYWKGQMRQYFSLEIASLEGQLHFYIRTPSKFVKIIESQIYAQYSQAEVFEVEDYTKNIPDIVKNGPTSLWGCNFELTKDDPYPIKTYIDFGLDKAGGPLKDDESIDPMTPMLEYMGSIGAGQNIFFQILVRADTKRFTVKNKDGVEENGKDWKEKAKEIADKLRKELTPAKKEGEPFTPSLTTKGQTSIIEAIERSVTKFGFDCGMRAVFVTDSTKFNADLIAGLTGMVRQFNAGDLNGFKPTNPTAFDFPWQDVSGNNVIAKKKDMLDAYKARQYFYGSFDIKNIGTYFHHPEKSGKKPFILNTEELATIFHLPGRVATTPTFTRIESTKAEPPANLPI